MRKRVIVFDDTPRHLAEFRRSLEAAGCEVMAFDHCMPHQCEESIRQFKPDLAVVDSHFGDEVDGLTLTRDLCEICPDIAIVVCSVLLVPGGRRREAIMEQYRRIGAVRKILSKNGSGGDILPDPEEILAL